MASEGRGERGWYHVHVRLTRDDYDYLRRRSAESAEPVSTILRSMIRAARARGRAGEPPARGADWSAAGRPSK